MSPTTVDRIRLASLILIMLLWGIHLGYPMHRLQLARWTFLGYSVPSYYFLTVLLLAGSAACALAVKRRWALWETLWWSLPLICLPGILHSGDRLWSVRQWLSWIVRGVIPGGVIFLAGRRRTSSVLLLYWIYPVVIAASCFGLFEVFFSRNLLWDTFWNAVPATAQAGNPFYRPDAAIAIGLAPRGVQGNRAISASLIVGFLPLGFWLLKYKKPATVHLLGAATLLSMLLLSQVRAVWAATLAAMVLMPVVGLHRNWRDAVRIVGGTLLCLGAFLCWPKTSGILWARFNSFHLTNNSIRERLEVLRTVQVLKDQWLAGVGFGRFSVACRPYYPSSLVWNDTPDNQYLRWAIENGIVSFVLLLAFFVGLVRAGWKKIKAMKDPQETDFYKSLLVGWLSLAVTFLFFDGFYWGACNMTFWCLLGLFATCLSSTDLPSLSSTPQSRRTRD